MMVWITRHYTQRTEFATMCKVWVVCGADDCFEFCGGKAFEQEGLVSGKWEWMWWG
jgi:hypothetical protein